MRPIMRCASSPTACTSSVRVSTATTDGSDTRMPSPRTYTSVLAVPRSIAMSRPPMRTRRRRRTTPWWDTGPPLTRAGTPAPRARGDGPRGRVRSPSLPKMLVTCFSTARSVTTMCSAIALFERPSAISSSTSRSRGVSSSSGSSRRARPTSWETTSGSSAEPPSATRRTESTKRSTSATRSFSR